MTSGFVSRLMVTLGLLPLPKPASHHEAPVEIVGHPLKDGAFVSMTGKAGSRSAAVVLPSTACRGDTYQNHKGELVVVESQSRRRIYFRHAGTKRKPIASEIALRDDLDANVFYRIYKPYSAKAQKQPSLA